MFWLYVSPSNIVCAPAVAADNAIRTVKNAFLISVNINGKIIKFVLFRLRRFAGGLLCGYLLPPLPPLEPPPPPNEPPELLEDEPPPNEPPELRLELPEYEELELLLEVE